MKRAANNLTANEGRSGKRARASPWARLNLNRQVSGGRQPGFDHNTKYAVTVNRDKQEAGIPSGRKIEAGTIGAPRGKLNACATRSSVMQKFGFSSNFYCRRCGASVTRLTSEVWRAENCDSFSVQFGQASLWNSSIEISRCYY